MTKPRGFWLIAAVATTWGCGYSAPYETSGPSLSQEGVRVAIVGENCITNSGGDVIVPSVNDDLLNLGVRLQITNDSSLPITVLPDQFRLVGFEHGRRTEVWPRYRAPSTVPPGQAEQIQLSYRHYGNLDCEERLELDVTGAIARGDTPISLAPIEFVASR